MVAFVQRVTPLRRLLVRGCTLYLLLRVGIAMVSVAVAGSGGLAPDHPLGIIALVVILGAIDLRRRGEMMLWGNLGFSTATVLSMFAGPAIAGEILKAALST